MFRCGSTALHDAYFVAERLDSMQGMADSARLLKRCPRPDCVRTKYDVQIACANRLYDQASLCHEFAISFIATLHPPKVVSPSPSSLSLFLLQSTGSLGRRFLGTENLTSYYLCKGSTVDPPANIFRHCKYRPWLEVQAGHDESPLDALLFFFSSCDERYR